MDAERHSVSATTRPCTTRPAPDSFHTAVEMGKGGRAAVKHRLVREGRDLSAFVEYLECLLVAWLPTPEDRVGIISSGNTPKHSCREDSAIPCKTICRSHKPTQELSLRHRVLL